MHIMPNGQQTNIHAQLSINHATHRQLEWTLSDGDPHFTSTEQMTQSVSSSGSLLSTTSTSLEKRCKMRPTGVVSKKWLGSRITRSSSTLWIRRHALQQPK